MNLAAAQLLLLHLLASSLAFGLSLAAPDNTSTTTAVDSPQPQQGVSFSFYFSDSSTYNVADLRFEGDAGLHRNLVDLTCNSYGQHINRCTGRMSYAHPVLFYSNAAGGEVASFRTRFTFIISNPNNTNVGDGMAFFLSAYHSSLPDEAGGGRLGLINDSSSYTYGAERFVAVEFDTYSNEWAHDPVWDHIGIDINSVQSLNVTRTSPLSTSGPMTATVTFDNITRMLVASLQLNDDPSSQPYEVSKQLPADLTSLLPPEVEVGFSGSTGDSTELHQILAWSFNSTLAAAPHKGRDKKPAIIGGGVALVALSVLLMVWCIPACWKWTRRRRAIEQHEIQAPRRFEYQDLAVATDNFSEERKLGQGAFGVVYKGSLKKPDGEAVAVKKILKETHSPDGNKDFFAELNTISAAKHKNLIKLVGWCRGNNWTAFDFMCWCEQKKTDMLFLVYELMLNGNLDYHLNKQEVLPWSTRYQIVKDIACALFYLHDQCRPYILHRDIKPSNILLDENFHAKLADFGLSRIADLDNSTVETTAVGTEGYLDPHCRKQGMVRFNKDSDIYSFGIVLLDITCRKRRDKVWELYLMKSPLKAADDKLGGEFDESQMERVIVLGLWCSSLENTKRPNIQQVMDVLEHDAKLPELSMETTTDIITQHAETCVIDSQAPCSDAGSSSYHEQNA